MADVQISNPATAAGSSDYLIKPGVELLLKAVNADFDGSGAAGSYLPAVVITSDSGHVIARALDPSSPVSAGGSAEASFFPGVKGAGAAATALNVPWAIMDAQGGEALAHSTAGTLALATANFNTNEPGVFTIRAGAPPFQGIAIHEVGIYYVSWTVLALTTGAAAPAPSATMLVIAPGVTFAGTDLIAIDLTDSESYGYILQGSIPNDNHWNVRYVALVAIESVSSERALTLGAQNLSPSYDFPATGGQGLFGTIFAMRLSDGLASYATFF